MRISVVVSPGAKQQKVERRGPGEYAVWVRERPREGKANDAVISAISDFFDVPKTTLEIVRGRHSRVKVINIPTVLRKDTA